MALNERNPLSLPAILGDEDLKQQEEHIDHDQKPSDSCTSSQIIQHGRHRKWSQRQPATRKRGPSLWQTQTWVWVASLLLRLGTPLGFRGKPQGNHNFGRYPDKRHIRMIFIWAGTSFVWGFMSTLQRSKGPLNSNGIVGY